MSPSFTSSSQRLNRPFDVSPKPSPSTLSKVLLINSSKLNDHGINSAIGQRSTSSLITESLNSTIPEVRFYLNDIFVLSCCHENGLSSRLYG